MHYALVAVVIVWFVFLAPIRVVAVTAVGCFLIAASVRAVASALSGMQISYGSAIKAVFLSVFLLLITMLMIAGGLSHFSLLTLVVLNPLVVLVSLFGAYVLGYHLCLGTTFGASTIVAVLSTLVSIAVVLGLRSAIS